MAKFSAFQYYSTSPEIILLAVTKYVRFPHLLRNFEYLLQSVAPTSVTILCAFVKRALPNLRRSAAAVASGTKAARLLEP